jgi:hypothetical protein
LFHRPFAREEKIGELKNYYLYDVIKYNVVRSRTFIMNKFEKKHKVESIMPLPLTPETFQSNSKYLPLKC